VIGVELAGRLRTSSPSPPESSTDWGGNNAKAALVTRGWSRSPPGFGDGRQGRHVHRLGGLGDLMTTCVSPEGRNRSVGERIGKGQQLKDILAQMDSVAEGVPTTRSVMQLARRHHVEMPITEAVHAVLFENKDVLNAWAI